MQALLCPGNNSVTTATLLEEFEGHEPCLCKVYCLGTDSAAQRRRTLVLSPALLERADESGVIHLPRMSTSRAAAAVPGAQVPHAWLRSSAVSAPTADTVPTSGNSSSAAAHGSAAQCTILAETPPQGQLNKVQRGGRTAAEPAPAGSGLGDGWAAAENSQACLVPPWLPAALCAHLRNTLGLSLFNVDLIQPLRSSLQAHDAQPELPAGNGASNRACSGRTGAVPVGADTSEHDLRGHDPADVVQRFLAVDINFFPGFNKLPDFERRFVDFLVDAVRD